MAPSSASSRSRRLLRGPTIQPIALKGLGDGHCNGFAPEGWRVAGHEKDDSMFHVMAEEGFAHAVFRSARLQGRDPESFVRVFLSETFGAPAVLTPPQARPFGFVLQDFGNARGGAGFVEETLPGHVSPPTGGKKLERHQPLEHQVLGFVDDTHAPFAELREQSVVGDSLPDA